MTRPLSVGITMGDPAGVGPEIVCRALADLSPSNRAQMIVFGTKSILERANALTGAAPTSGPGSKPGP
jgi:4-hydroxy-L-threonine phosphate dehydrogenase PdxA